MDAAEYDRQFRSQRPLITEEVVGDFTEGIGRPKVTIVNSTPEEMYREEMKYLETCGPDYAGLEQIAGFIRRMGR